MVDLAKTRNRMNLLNGAMANASRLPAAARASFEGSLFAFYFYYPRYFAGAAALHGGRYR